MQKLECIRVWKNGLACTILGFVHTTPEKFEKAALFLQIVPTVYTNPSRKRSFRRRSSSSSRQFENASLCPAFRVDGKNFKNGAFWKWFSHDNHVIALVFLKHKFKMTGDGWVFKFLRRSLDGKNLMRFQSETAVFKSFYVVWTLPKHVECMLNISSM